MEPVVIVGTGLAGYTVAREFRKLDQDTPLVLLSADDGGFYSKPMLSNALAQGKTADDLLTAPAAQMAAQLRADVRANTHVTALDAVHRGLVLDSGALAYSRLVLAVGADPIRLPLNGDAANQVLSVNDRAGYARFRAQIAGKRRVALLGGGLIGCEFANDLVASGYSVSVIDIASHPLGRLVPPEVGQNLRDTLAGIGVDWHLGVSAVAVERSADRCKITLSDSTEVFADVVLSAVGLRPRIDLAATAGLMVNRGVVTDRLLATSAAGVFALGDCAEVDGLVLPFVMPLMHGARALALTLTGKPVAVSYPAMPVVVKTPACPLVIAPPPVKAEGHWVSEATADGVRALFRTSGGALLGFALAGTAAVADKQALSRQLPPTLA